MKVTFAPKDVVQIDDAKIIFKNFEGRGSKFNREGDKNFAVIIDDQDIADALIEKGYNVKIKPPRDVDDEPFMYLTVKVKFNGRGPKIYLRSGDSQHRLDEEGAECIDNMDIVSVDLDISPYDWVVQEGTPNERQGRTAYLRSMLVTQEVDRFSED